NRFYNELEDWLSGAAQVTTGGGTIEGDLPVPAYLQALVEQTAENLDMLQRSTTAGEEERRQTAAAMMALAEKLSTLNDHMRTQHAVLVRVAETQTELRPLIARLAEAASTDRFGIDEQTRHHIRNIETYADRLVQELATGRAQTVAEIRAEIKLLA